MRKLCFYEKLLFAVPWISDVLGSCYVPTSQWFSAYFCTVSVGSLTATLTRWALFSIWGIPTDINMRLQWQLKIRLRFLSVKTKTVLLALCLQPAWVQIAATTSCYILAFTSLEGDKNKAAWGGLRGWDRQLTGCGCFHLTGWGVICLCDIT